MDSYTTEEIILDDSDYYDSVYYDSDYYDSDYYPEKMQPTLPPRPVNHGRLAAPTIYVVFAGLSSLCVLITVIRTKSVRGQLLGVMLISLIVAILIRAMVVVSRDIETVFSRRNCKLWNFWMSFILHGKVFIWLCSQPCYCNYLP